MNAKRVPFRSQGNPLYPLPPDYHTLTHEARRLARVNALRQHDLWWGPNESPMRAEAYVSALHFLDHHYLRPEVSEDGTVLFDPMFYRHPLPTPPAHWTIYRAHAIDRTTVVTGPRGWAKTFLLVKDSILNCVALPAYEELYATASNDLAEIVGDKVKFQCYENSRIHDDFAPEYGGKMKPNRTEGKMGMNDFALSNRAMFRATSAQSRQRGRRPVKYKLDDPEWDESASTSMEERRDFMEWLIFRIALPMLQQPRTSLIWPGTFVSRRHYLYHAMQTITVVEDGVPVERAADERFDGWTRIFVPAALEVDGRLQSCWPEMWPVDAAERDALGLDPSTRTIAQIRKELGEATFQAEFMGNPGAGGAAHFKTMTAEEHGYTLEAPDELFGTTPWLSLTTIKWMRTAEGKSTPMKMTLKEFCEKYPRFITVDGAYTVSASSDYKAAACMALTEVNELFVFDVWAARVPDEKVCFEVFGMGDRWHARTIHPESIKGTIKLAEMLRTFARDRASDVFGVKHIPQVLPFTPSIVEKSAKINAALTWRFEYGKIKYPLALMQRGSGAWGQLRDQTIGFNPTASDCGLANDDLLDCVSMHTESVPASRLAAAEFKKSIDKRSPIERMKDGETVFSDGTPLMESAIHSMTPGDLDAILAKRAAASTASVESI